MKDYVVRATAAEGQIRAFAARTTNTIKEAQKIHTLFPVATAALGRVMSAAAMMAVDLKDEKNSLSIIINGNGPMGSVVTVASPNGDIKGYVNNPHVDLPLNSYGKLDVGGAVGRDGKLTIIKDLGLKEPYIGQVELVTGEIGEDITSYFWISEQQPSVVALGTLVDTDLTPAAAGGFIIQPMPGADESLIEQIEKKLGEIEPISTMIYKGMYPEEILEKILTDLNIKINARSDVQFKCDCSRERLEGVIISLGQKELKSIIEEDGQAELVCHYCSKKYQFNREQLEWLLEHATN